MIRSKSKLWTFLLMLPALSFSQTYQWQWAKQAGGETGSADPGFNYQSDEFIRDIVVDKDNNTYYLAMMRKQQHNLNGAPVTNYGLSDMFLFSTDCAGNVRWSTAIGGSGNDENAWNLEVDDNGGLYVMATLYNETQVGDPNGVPLHLDDTHIIPPFTFTGLDGIDPGYKSAYLLKYNTSNGKLTWDKPLQGDVSFSSRYCDAQMMYMDSSKNIHTILGFRKGTHLGGLITVPSTYTSSFQYYLVKFNYDNGNMTPTPPLLLPITGSIGLGVKNGKSNLVYDEGLNRYYLAGNRVDSGSGLEALSYNNVPFTKEAYLLAFNGSTGTEVWRKELDNHYTNTDDQIHSIIKGSGSSDIYISGRYFNAMTAQATFGNYTFPSRSYEETVPFVMKLNADGAVQWATTANGMSNNYGFYFSKGVLALNGNEVAFAKGSRSDIWGNYAMTPSTAQADPLLVRFNKDTGTVIGTQQIHSDSGSWDEFTSIAVDKDGNYVLGGFFHNELFTNPSDGLSTMAKNVIGNKSQSFFAKYSKSACSQLSVVETPSSEAGIQLYPNPVQDVLHIKSKEPLVSYEIYGATGQAVKQGAFSMSQEQLVLSSLPTGVYYIRLKTKSATVTEKFIKK